MPSEPMISPGDDAAVAAASPAVEQLLPAAADAGGPPPVQGSTPDAVPTVSLPIAGAPAAPAAPKPLPEHRFFGMTPESFDAVVGKLGWPKYRAQQVRQWAYEKAVGTPDGMTNLSKLDRDRLAEKVSFARATLARRQLSDDGTLKLLLEWHDDPTVGGKTANAETVMIPDGDRRTACVSSQVGCPVGCKFCASGLAGVKGSLTADQIVEQVHQLNVQLKPAGERVTNIVFMGMGEPLANYANVMRAIRLLHDPRCFNIGARRITISTVGVPPKMRELAEEELPLNLAISLHAPTEKLRRSLIPWADHFALDDILDAARYYFDRTGREITLEYILLAGVNDRPEHARQLAKVCHTMRANVNLIRYNEVEGLPFGRPKAADVLEFQNVLRANGVNAHVRKSRGRDIDAACGQLRRKRELEQQQEAGAVPTA
ncbi:MAG TPA: 23S rRNA (adenine(2503)-C(2))-methyltransferase RlmN [Humisphaera sp.]